MTVTFYNAVASPPCVAVALAIRALGVDVTTKIVNMGAGEHKTPEFLKVNPRGFVPALSDDGVGLGESRAIITYLANKYAPTSDLYPSDPARRAAVDMWLHFDNSVLDAGQRYYFSTLFGEQKMPESKPEKEVKFKAALTELDTHLSQSKFVAGNEFTVADISVLGSTFFADGFDYDLTGYANIKRWEADAKAQLPFYDEIVNEALPALKGFIGFMKSKVSA
ncbi:Glutathione S-transferase 1, isoform C [Halotydeus destructor]|nr:Glutathione S-transferase 1, isoform C [Halotydeus destructor]